MSGGKVLGLIPAKGGSTRLARKNVAPLGGKPLIQWAAEAARESGVIDRLILSTEDEPLAETAAALGIEVPFLRPAELATDPAGVVDVALHALGTLREGGEEYETLVILLPTCPFRTAADVGDAVRLFGDHRAKFLMSVNEFPHTPFAALSLSDDAILTPYFPEHLGKKSQEMPKAYRPNGAIHVLDIPSFEEARTYFAQPLVGYVMPIERSVDIDTADDLAMAEALLAARKGRP